MSDNDAGFTKKQKGEIVKLSFKVSVFTGLAWLFIKAIPEYLEVAVLALEQLANQ